MSFLRFLMIFWGSVCTHCEITPARTHTVWYTWVHRCPHSTHSTATTQTCARREMKIRTCVCIACICISFVSVFFIFRSAPGSLVCMCARTLLHTHTHTHTHTHSCIAPRCVTHIMTQSERPTTTSKCSKVQLLHDIAGALCVRMHAPAQLCSRVPASTATHLYLRKNTLTCKQIYTYILYIHTYIHACMHIQNITALVLHRCT